LSIAVACTIAGSDSGGGAGIQADLKTFAALGVYGTSAIVAVTAQNTLGVRGVELVSPAMVSAQIDAIVEDFHPQAFKTGMLATADLVGAVVDRLRHHAARNLVVDPVMIAKSGDRLLDEGAVAAIRESLLPLAAVVTPNLPEAAALTGIEATGTATRREVARALAATGARVVVVKGGHAPGETVTDLIFDSRDGAFHVLEYPRVPGRHTHGTGCTFSAAIAAYLARGQEPVAAIRLARAYLQLALERAPGLGAGHGPLGHGDLLREHDS
jgi:hydroxymethylpyrimidine/phosphomethylpyrimidine kinase